MFGRMFAVTVTGDIISRHRVFAWFPIQPHERRFFPARNCRKQAEKVNAQTRALENAGEFTANSERVYALAGHSGLPWKKHSKG